MNILKRIKSTTDIRSLDKEEVAALCEELRKEIISVVSQQGGHLAPNLGVVELTVGMHLALDAPADKIIWDVGHQCYANKLLTGRADQFPTLRSYGGIGGFPRREESPHDVCNTGHASTAISTALGLAKARDMRGEKWTVVAVVGDGSLTGGLAYEGLNQAGHLGSDLIVILNDNDMSIDNNVGALSSYLNRIRNDIGMKRIRDEIKDKLQKIPGIGPFMVNVGESVEDAAKHLLVPGRLFEELGFRYVGPIDGHDPWEVARQIEFAKESGGPVLVHCHTIKGKGYAPAEKRPEQFHGTPPFDQETGLPLSSGESNGQKADESPRAYTEVFGQALVELAEKDQNIVAITAAMSTGTGLDAFAKNFPDRFFDVGIAESHAVTFASGLALQGFRPVVAVYSTFLQRAYDQIIHDTALQEAPVIFAIDRAGLVGEDGPTHHGLYDLSYLRSIPGMTVMAPSNEQELRDMLFTAIQMQGPVAIRFPRGKGPGSKLGGFESVENGTASVIQSGSDILILAVGRMVANALQAAELLSREGISATVVNVRFVKPFDRELFSRLIPIHKLTMTIEENTSGGFGAGIAEFIAESGFGVASQFCHTPDRFITHGSVEALMKDVKLDASSLVERALSILGPPSKAAKAAIRAK